MAENSQQGRAEPPKKTKDFKKLKKEYTKFKEEIMQ